MATVVPFVRLCGAACLLVALPAESAIAPASTSGGSPRRKLGSYGRSWLSTATSGGEERFRLTNDRGVMRP